MAWTATDFAGRGCGRRYEKELETHFRDCMLFYLDGRIRFERYCYGEAACLVFSVWGTASTLTANCCGTGNRNLKASRPPCLGI